MLGLTRRRRLLVAMAITVALTAFAAPALAGIPAHCAVADDSGCPPALLIAELRWTLIPCGLVNRDEAPVSPPLFVDAILKIPLTR